MGEVGGRASVGISAIRGLPSSKRSGFSAGLASLSLVNSANVPKAVLFTASVPRAGDVSLARCRGMIGKRRVVVVGERKARRCHGQVFPISIGRCRGPHPAAGVDSFRPGGQVRLSSHLS